MREKCLFRLMVTKLMKPFSLQLNLYMTYKNLWVDGLSLGAGIYNALNEDIFYLQPYSGDHAALPGASRSYRVKLSYNLF